MLWRSTSRPLRHSLPRLRSNSARHVLALTLSDSFPASSIAHTSRPAPITTTRRGAPALLHRSPSTLTAGDVSTACGDAALAPPVRRALAEHSLEDFAEVGLIREPRTESNFTQGFWTR